MGKRLVEDCLTLDLAWLMRLAPIGAGQAGNGKIKWSRDGDVIGWAQFRLDLLETEKARLLLRFCPAGHGSGREPTRQAIALTTVPQHLGGYRWWLHCPVTGERARVLYLPPDGDRFASRKAWRLVYRVEQLNRFDRAFEKLFRAQRRLGNSQGLGAELSRPKGMWRRTFVGHAERFQILDLNCAEKIVAMIEGA